VKERAGVDCRFHDLRITAATKMAENAVPEAVAMDVLGHDREVTERT
jgi:integrase